VVVDPSLKEEAAMRGMLTVCLNPQGELCALQKAGGVAVSTSQIMRCV
jgi:exosome complex component RRP45